MSFALLVKSGYINRLNQDKYIPKCHAYMYINRYMYIYKSSLNQFTPNIIHATYNVFPVNDDDFF